MKKFLAALLVSSCFALPAFAQTQCVTNALAGGTVDAITVPLLPCGLATNVLILTLSGANTVTNPTLRMAGFPALPIYTSAGGAVPIGALSGAGAVVMLTGTGTSWKVIADGSAQISSPVSVANGGTGATTLTSHGVVYGNGTSTVGVSAAGTTGQILVGSTGAGPVWGSLAAVSGTLPVANGGTAGVTGSAAGKNLSLVYVLCQSNAQVGLTGTIATTAMASCQIPAGLLGTNGSIRVYTTFSRPAGQSVTASMAVLFGTANNVSGTQMTTQIIASTARVVNNMVVISNKNVANSQSSAIGGNLGTTSTTALVTASVDTASASWVVISGSLGNTGDVLNLETLIVEIVPGGGN